MKEHGNTRLFNRWLESQSRNAQNIVPYNAEWATAWTNLYDEDDPINYNNPENMQPYSRLSSLVHNIVKGRVPNAKKEPYYNFRVQAIVSQIWESIKNSVSKEDRNAYITANLQAITTKVLHNWDAHRNTMRTYDFQLLYVFNNKKKVF
jgi:hypothetical protein